MVEIFDYTLKYNHTGNIRDERAFSIILEASDIYGDRDLRSRSAYVTRLFTRGDFGVLVDRRIESIDFSIEGIFDVNITRRHINIIPSRRMEVRIFTDDDPRKTGLKRTYTFDENINIRFNMIKRVR